MRFQAKWFTFRSIKEIAELLPGKSKESVTMGHESKPPEGEITLSWKCYERDYNTDYEVVTLQPDGDNLLLVIENKNQPLKSSLPRTSQTKYSITPRSLIDLIKEHGEKISG